MSSLASSRWTEFFQDQRGFLYRWRDLPNGEREYDYDYSLQSQQQEAPATPRTIGDGRRAGRQPSISHPTSSWRSESTNDAYTLSRSPSPSATAETSRNQESQPSDAASFSRNDKSSYQYRSQEHEDCQPDSLRSSNQQQAPPREFLTPGNSGRVLDSVANPPISYSPYASPAQLQSYGHVAPSNSASFNPSPTGHGSMYSAFPKSSTPSPSQGYFQGYKNLPQGTPAVPPYGDPVNETMREFDDLSLGNTSRNEGPEFRASNSDRPSTPPQESSKTEKKNRRKLDDRYKKIDSKKYNKFYQPGRLFMTLWTEPAGEGARAGPVGSDSQFTRTYLGGTSYSEIRRFVVVRKNHGNVLCCAINSYRGQGCLKPNLSDKDQHAIIHTSSKPPMELFYQASDGSHVYEDLIKDSIRVNSEETYKEADLGHCSRLNYSKFYTIEFSARVLNIGMVHQNFIPTLITSAGVKQPDESSHRSKKSHNSSSKPSGEQQQKSQSGESKKTGKQ